MASRTDFCYSEFYMAPVSKIKIDGSNSLAIKGAILKAVDEIGGFEKFVRTGDVVMLKPNFNSADPYPASTDFEFLKAVVELVYESGAKLVVIADSSTMTLNTRKVMEKLKIFDLQNTEQPARVYVLEEGNWIKKTIPAAQYLKSVSVPEILERIDKLILLPCLKTHKQASFTGSLKLSVGFMKPLQRVGLHLKNIEEKIAELNVVIKPDLIIMDSRKCFIGGGPFKGLVREPNLIMASISRVAIDIEGVKIIQGFDGNTLKKIKAEDLKQIKRAIEMGIDI